MVRFRSTMPFTHELNLVTEAVRRAMALLLRHYATEFAVDWKSEGDPVTAADRAVNALLVESLRAGFPGDGICAEESDGVEAARAAGAGGRCWFVDPLDGTREFVQRNGEFCTMVGLAVGGEATLGVVGVPTTGEVWVGVVGEGAWSLDPAGGRRPLRVVPPGEGAPLRAVVSRSHPHPDTRAALARLGDTRLVPCGSVGLKVGRVAEGAADLYLHLGGGPKLWDGCGPEAIARAAGAAVLDTQGHPLRYDTADLGLDRGLVVAHPTLLPRLWEALGRS